MASEEHKERVGTCEAYRRFCPFFLYIGNMTFDICGISEESACR